jgi:O-antigen/teichoic acid export membrane protein
LLVFGFGIKGVLVGYIIASFLGFFIRMLIINRTLAEYNLGKWWNADLNLIRNHVKAIIWFLGNTSLAATVRIGEDKFFGTLILGYYAGKEAVAFYNVATSVAKLVNFIIDPLYEALYPDLVRIKALNGLQEMKDIIKLITKHIMLVAIPIIAIIIIFSDQIVGLIFGKEYSAASDALRIIAGAILIARITFWINPVLLAMEKPGLRTMLGLVSTSLYLILLFILVPQYSYLGASFAYLGFSVIKSSMSVYLFSNLFATSSKKGNV